MNEEAAMDVIEEESSTNACNGNEREALELRIKELESKLTKNKNVYDSHVELIDSYVKLNDLKSLQNAFRRFHECFPLTPELWLQWIEIEKKLATSDKEKQTILTLFEKAVEDYLSIDLWQEYANYSMKVADLERTRKVLEKSLISAGLHVKDGAVLWDFLREIESDCLLTFPKDSDAWKEQVAKVVEIFRRQLSVPLLGMEETYNKWKVWKETLPENFELDTQPIEWGYQKALKVLETYKTFEEDLATSTDDNETFEIYKKYVTAVEDTSTVICVYERAVCELCLTPSLWLDYCNFVFKLEEVALKTSQRSLRNCSWSEELWIMNLRILENLNSKQTDVMASFELGLSNIKPSSGLQLWFAYVEFVYRKSEDMEKLFKLLAQASEYVGDEDTNCSLDRFRARILAKNGKLKEAITIWNNIIGTYMNKGNLTLWLEFISLVKQFGEVNHVRCLYHRALNSSSDWVDYMTEEALLFEREHGNLSSVMAFEAISEKAQYHLEDYSNNQQEPTTNLEAIESNRKGKKRKCELDNKKQAQNMKDDAKKMKKEVENVHIIPKKPILKDPTKTVFVSNISRNADEETLKSMFPNAENIEVCKDRKGKSKCFGYVQFGLEEEVRTALARDREPLDGRPLFISVCKPDKNERKTVFKYSSGIEENKLFVRGLPKSLSEEEVMDIFKPFGAVNTRVVLHRSGQSKGLAYVEFPDSESTKKALKATDQMVLGEHTITVVVSDPPTKTAAAEKVIEPTRHARSRLQLALIPRPLQGKLDEGSSTENNASKSNDDFRKMLTE
ncbi:hypothetical protein WA026_011687 [Henosepilachna vigintioctopunctata]|uniref:RRM domain-containing protein n=1 Tax=Henosepilachna vigintioctopunctata TaxID=420089 RepID=A0AAW1UH72_9CUCU